MAEEHPDASDQTVVPDEFATVKQPSAAGPRIWLARAVELPVRLGRYELLSLLGEGAMGVVYLARDMQLERQVAIKIPKLAKSSALEIRRFEREARAMATLRHPNLCPIYDVGEIDGFHFLSMAYVQGQTLAVHLSRAMALPGPAVALLILKLAQAAGEAHRSGIVHRDLKPANIMIDQRREPVVMDFGLTGLADGKSSLTHPGVMIGTPAYMSPEQMRGDLNSIGPASDVYSLGAIMYQMLTGSLPFEGSIASIVRQTLAETPDSPSSLEDGVDPQLGAICLRAMEKSPSERFSSGDEFANVLRDYLRGLQPKPVSLLSASNVADAARPDHVTQAAEVREHWQRGDYAAALPILERIAKLTDPAAAAYAGWAQRELPNAHDKLDWLAAHEEFLQLPTLLPTARLIRPRIVKEQQGPRRLIWALAVAGLLLLTVVVVASKQNARDKDVAERAASQTDRDDDEPSPAARQTADHGVFAPVASEENAVSLDAEFVVAEDPATDSAEPSTPIPVPLDDADAAKLTTTPDEPSARQSPRPPTYERLLRDFDLNGNAVLEVIEIPPPHRDQLSPADTNDDGIVSREELEKFRARFARPPQRP